MIRNVPTSEDLDSSALTAFFSAWNSLFHLLTDFDQAYGIKNKKYEEELIDYFEHCKAEIESIYALAAQANELALKARICRVSPYLLLIGNDAKFRASEKDIEFTSMRTIDAVDLPNAANTICGEQVSDDFKRRYNELRSIRNAIAHIGTAKLKHTPFDAINLLIGFYTDLWREKRFVAAWLDYLSSTRYSFFHDGKWASAELELIEMWSAFKSLIGPSKFLTLVGATKAGLKYTCPNCYFGGLRGGDHGPDEFQVVHVDKGKKKAACIACEKRYDVKEGECGNGCGGKFRISSGECKGVCLTCLDKQHA